jgi:hypothetical protein
MILENACNRNKNVEDCITCEAKIVTKLQQTVHGCSAAVALHLADVTYTKLGGIGGGPGWDLIISTTGMRLPATHLWCLT